MRLFPRAAPEVISVSYEMPPEVVPFIPTKFEDFVKTFGACLMSPLLANTDRIWYLTKNWKCLVTLDVGFLECEARRGWWLDWASIPGLLESVEKRDDRNGLVAATLHDMFYSVQYPFFDTANDLFYKIMRLEGTGFFQAHYKWRAVESAGWTAWEESSSPEKVEIEKQWVIVSEVPCVSPTFKHLLRPKC